MEYNLTINDSFIILGIGMIFGIVSNLGFSLIGWLIYTLHNFFKRG